MKQRITIEQLNELSDEQKVKLRGWFQDQINNGEVRDWMIWSPHQDRENGNPYGGYYHMHGYKDSLPLLTIGQMIEFLGEVEAGTDGDAGYIDTYYSEDADTWRHISGTGILLWNELHIENLCDALWEAVKTKLKVLSNPQ